jgi:glycosyltransferase involved in cell wall biosynthesis
MDLISVVIPALNAQAYLGQAIDSVLAQGWPDLEVLVVDNASTDATTAVAASYGPPVRCLACAIPGQPPTMNLGIGEARGTWLAFVDADDLWAPGKLSRQIAEFSAHPELDAVFGHAVNFSGATPDPQAGPWVEMPAPLHGTLLIRRDAFLRVGVFDERYTIGAILDWYLRAQEAGLNMRVLPEVFLYRRLHGDNLSLRRKDRQSDFARILKASLDRRRRQSGGKAAGSADEPGR